MSGLFWAVLGVLGSLGMTVLGDLVSEEVRDRLDHLPHAILRLAARRLDPAQRVAVYEDEWLPELTYILKGDEARPITRLVHGMRYAFGILVSVRRITRYLHRAAPAAVSDDRGFIGRTVALWRVIRVVPTVFKVLSDDADVETRALEIKRLGDAIRPYGEDDGIPR